MANGSIHKIARAVHSGRSICRQYERETRLGFLNRHLPTRDSLGGKRLGELRYYDPQGGVIQERDGTLAEMSRSPLRLGARVEMHFEARVQDLDCRVCASAGQFWPMWISLQVV